MMLESLAELRLFLEIASAGSFTRAARALGMTLKSASRRMGQLEARLGVRLLHRTTRSVALTEEGRRFLDAGRRILEEVEHAEAELALQSRAIAGRVRVAVPTAALQHGLLEELGRLLAENRDLRVQVWVSDQPVDLVAQGIDVALAGERVSTSDVVRQIGRLVGALAASPAYVRVHGRPRAPADLARHECLRFFDREPQTSWTLIHASGRRVRAQVGGRFECNDSRALRDALYAGLGIGVRPVGEIRRAVEAGTLMPVLPAYQLAPMVMRAVVPSRPGRHRARRVEAVVEVLRETIRRLE